MKGGSKQGQSRKRGAKVGVKVGPIPTSTTTLTPGLLEFLNPSFAAFALFGALGAVVADGTTQFWDSEAHLAQSHLILTDLDDLVTNPDNPYPLN